MTITLTRLDNTKATLSSQDFDAFNAGFKGPVLVLEDPAYEDTRKIWNAMIDQRPGLVARCTGWRQCWASSRPRALPA
jgi:hypothetical protein